MFSKKGIGKMKRHEKGLALLAALLLLIPSAAAGTEPRHATVEETSGDVLAKIAGGEWQPAEKGMVLREKDELRTMEGATAQVLLDDGKVGQVEVREKSYFRLNTLRENDQSGDKTTLLDLAQGKLRVHAQKLKGKSKFEVRTPTAIAGVRGTVFDVSVDEKA